MEPTSLMLTLTPRRRTWFLERLLKLGRIDVRKEYTCVSQRHPSLRREQGRILHTSDRRRSGPIAPTRPGARPSWTTSGVKPTWLSAAMAHLSPLSHSGEPEASTARSTEYALRSSYPRCLSQLETFPTNPSLVMPNLLCQETAKTWVMLREYAPFQRTIQQEERGSWSLRRDEQFSTACSRPRSSLARSAREPRR
jgi:hypothetical protein